MNFLLILFFIFFYIHSGIFAQTNETYNNIIYGTKERKIAEIKNISKLPKKDIENIFNILITEQDPEVCSILINQIKETLPYNFVLPKIIKLLSLPQEKQNQQLLNTIKNYIYTFNNEFTFNLIKEKIFSDDVDLQQKFHLITFLDIFSYEKVLPIIQSLYTKQDIIRLAIAILAGSFNDENTKNILIEYLKDEIPEIQIQAVKSLMKRKNWDTLPLILPMIKNKYLSEKIKEILLQIDDINAAKSFLFCYSLFEEIEIKKICLSQIGKYKNIDFLPNLIELYKIEKNLEIKQAIKETLQNYKDNQSQKILISHIHNLQIQELVVSLLLQIYSEESIPYLLKFYSKLPEYLQTQIDVFISSITAPSMIYYLLYYVDTKNLKLKCTIINSLMLYDNQQVYLKIENEILHSKNEKVLSTIILSLTKLKNYEKQILFLKLLIDKCKKNTDLLSQILNIIEELIKLQNRNLILLLPELLTLMDHKNYNIRHQAYEINKKLIQDASKEEIKIIYPIIFKLSDRSKIIIVELLLNKSDYEFLSLIPELYYKTKSKELKILLCKYLLELTKSVSHQIILEALKSKDIKFQTAILQLCKGKTSYEDIQIFLSFCMSKNKTIKLTAAEIVEDLITEREKTYSLHFIEDNDPQIQLIGIKTLSKISPIEFISLCEKLLKSKNENIRKLTLEKLTEILQKDKKIIKDELKTIIVDIIKYDVSDEVKTLAIKLLTILNYYTDEIINIYFEFLSSYNKPLKDTAEEAFNKILSSNSFSDISQIYIKGLISEKSSINKFFLEKIIEFKPNYKEIKQQIKTLILTTNDAEIRILSQKALTEILTQNDFSILEELYQTENIALKTLILEQLPKFTNLPESEKLLLYALKEPQNVVRQKAVEVSKFFLNSKKIYDAIVYISHNDTNYSIRSMANKILKSK